MQWSKVKSVRKLDGDTQSMWDISCYPIPSFFANGIAVHNCSYCESPLSGSWVVRAMNPKRVVDEVQQVRDDFGIHGTMWYDDEMNLDKKRVLGICERLKALGDITWRGFMVTAKFDEEIARACKESGCYEVASGIESGSPTILKAIHKPATREMNKRFVITAKRMGLRVKTFFICGLPFESWSTIRETDRFLEELKAEGCEPDDCDFSLLQIYKGSELYKRPLDIEFEREWEDKAYYKSVASAYSDLVQVKTGSMSKEDLVAARNFLENKWKKTGFVKDRIDRHDYDKVMETIHYAEQKIIRTNT